MVSLLASKYTFNITNIIIIINYIIFIILVIIMMEFLLAHWRVGCESTPRPVPSLGSTAPEPLFPLKRAVPSHQWRTGRAPRDIASHQHQRLVFGWEGCVRDSDRG